MYPKTKWMMIIYILIPKRFYFMCVILWNLHKIWHRSTHNFMGKVLNYPRASTKHNSGQKRRRCKPIYIIPKKFYLMTKYSTTPKSSKISSWSPKCFHRKYEEFEGKNLVIPKIFEKGSYPPKKFKKEFVHPSPNNLHKPHIP